MHGTRGGRLFVSAATSVRRTFILSKFFLIFHKYIFIFQKLFYTFSKSMNDNIPEWVRGLSGEDLQFIKRLVLHSGSLKAVAEEYGVSYPTLRLRLDRLIAKLRVLDEESGDDAFTRHIRLLAADGDISPAVARDILQSYQQSKRK